jgi:hypothetical protein
MRGKRRLYHRSEMEKARPMTRTKLALFSLVLALGASMAPSAFAQVHYYPTSGPISPWMNMWQRKPGPLDNYHQYVQPDLRLQGVISQQHNALSRNTAGIQVLGEQIGKNREILVQPTGTGSVFMEYSHYFPTGRGGVGHAHSAPRAAHPSAVAKYAR